MCDIIFVILSLLEKFLYYILNCEILFLLVSKDVSRTGGGRARRFCYSHPFAFGSHWDFVLLYGISFSILCKFGYRARQGFSADVLV